MNIINQIADSIFKNMGTSFGFSISMIFFIVLTIRAVLNLNKFKEVKSFFDNPNAIIQLIIIAFWILLVRNYINRQKDGDENSEKLKIATKKALISLLIAFFAKIDLAIAPFWLIWVVGYYLEDWV